MLKPLGALHATARSCRLAIDEADVYFFECLFGLGGDGVENLVIVGRELRSAFPAEIATDTYVLHWKTVGVLDCDFHDADVLEPTEAPHHRLQGQPVGRIAVALA
jgi:hypothetical protein